jgi:hypothetical protein
MYPLTPLGTRSKRFCQCGRAPQRSQFGQKIAVAQQKSNSGTELCQAYRIDCRPVPMPASGDVAGVEGSWKNYGRRREEIKNFSLPERDCRIRCICSGKLK